jgi:ABC-type oligopeptide transport system substrate-binding subunit
LYYDQSTQVKDQIIRQIKINWNEIGIDVKPEPLSAFEINDRLRSGNFDAVLLSHVFQETLGSLEEFFNSGFLNYDSHRLQQAFTNAKRFQGTPTFRAYMQRLQIIIIEDQPLNFLYHPWVIWHVINYAKFENAIDRDGNPKLFQEWELRMRP